ncbi:MAG: alpha/beta hydrolase domain-containing protein [Myxococcales bacterium]|nr:alpha/beta hydrolase domain-containing protein [Myxococcales bacterium]MDD9970881.1 alpha/beta hydrolase domain-containing protein [Myxococcales bacterium]
MRRLATIVIVLSSAMGACSREESGTEPVLPTQGISSAPAAAMGNAVAAPNEPAGMDTPASGMVGTAPSAQAEPMVAQSRDPVPNAERNMEGPDLAAMSDPDPAVMEEPMAGAVVDPDPDAPAVPDCNAEAWANPGNVDIPEVAEVEPSSGKGEPFGHALNLEEHGYVEHEFFFSSSSPMFKSRFLVVRPSDPAKFSGTVYVEWYNVSGTMDVPVMWSASQEYFLREGHVYVGVSAQQVGADSLRTVDEARYASISHPGDTYANTIFSRAGAAVRAKPETVLGPCMNPRAVIGMGQSQSSGRLASYLSSPEGSDQVYDVIMLHSGGSPPANPPVRTFVIRTMNEGNANSNGPNTVEWDVAGASHNDKRLTEKSFDIIGEAYGFEEIPFQCANPMNDYPAYRVYNAALDWMSRWATDEQRPPEGEPFEMAGVGYALDETGNMKGGVRLPDIDVPIKVYSSENAPADGADLFSFVIGGLACGLAGTANPMSKQQLMQLYPTHEDYVQKYTAAADKAVMAGFLLQEDYEEMIDLAEAAQVP